MPGQHKPTEPISGVPQAWEGHLVEVQHTIPGAESIESAPELTKGTLAKVSDYGIVLLSDSEQQGGIEQGLYFFPWTAITFIHLRS